MPTATQEPEIADPMDELDALAGITSKEKPAQKQDQAPKTEDKTEEEKPTAQKEAPDEEKDSPPASGAEEDSGVDKTLDEMFPRSEKFSRSKPLREAYDKALDSMNDLRKENDDLRKKLQGDDVISGLMEKNKAFEERIAVFERQQAITDYSKSREYKTNYLDPLEKAVDEGAELMAEMTIRGEKGPRNGTREDFLELMNMGTKEASELAQELFGPSAMMIMNLRHQARTLRSKSQTALKNAEENVSEIMRRKAVDDQETKAYAQKIWESASGKILARFPEVFGEDPDDPEYGKAIAKGLSEFDVAISDNPKVTQEQRLTLLAGMRYRAAALPAVLKRLRGASDRIEELEEELAKFKDSDPDAGGDGGSRANKKQGKGWQDDPDAPWQTSSRA